METYNEHSYLEMGIDQLESRVGRLEKALEKIEEVALILLPQGYKKETNATKKIITRIETDENGNRAYKSDFVCSVCGCKPINESDMFCRNCGATFIGFTIGKANDDED